MTQPDTFQRPPWPSDEWYCCRCATGWGVASSQTCVACGAPLVPARDAALFVFVAKRNAITTIETANGRRPMLTHRQPLDLATFAREQRIHPAKYSGPVGGESRHPPSKPGFVTYRVSAQLRLYFETTDQAKGEA